MKTLSRLMLFVLFALLTAAISSAQADPLPLPVAQQGRGAYAPSAPFAVPAEYASRARGSLYFVTTLADEDDGDCAGLNVMLSLREALTYCAASATTTIYIPPGHYNLTGVIDLPGFDSLTLIGASPLDTFIHVNQTPCTNGCTFLNLTLFDTPLAVMNLTISAIEAPGADGGGFDVAGYGTVDFYNMRFLANGARYGGAINIVAGGGGILASVNHVTFEGNAASLDGGAIRFASYTGNGNTLRVSNSHFNTNFAGTCDTYAGGAIAFYTDGGFGNDFVVENSLFEDNSADCAGAGAIYAWGANDSAIAVTIQDSVFTGNSTKMTGGQSGGAIAISNRLGSVQIQDSTFTGNQSQYGGGVNILSAKQVAINGSTFTDNTASGGSGGGVFVGSQIEPVGSVSITNSTLAGNHATYGGGAYLLADVVVIEDSRISGNNSSAYGGGLEFDVFGTVASIENTMLADNTSPIGPDCYIDDPSVSLISRGLNWLGSTVACPFIPAEYDEINNLVYNGGFELAQVLPTPSENKPAGWTVKNPGKGKRVCDTAAKPTPVKEYGKCAFVFTGGTGAKASITQNLDSISVVAFPGDGLLLSATGAGSTKSKLQVSLTVAYATGKPSKTKFTFNASYAHLDMGYAFSSLTIGPNPITKITVTAADKSASGKFTLDAVFVTLVPAVPRGSARTQGGVLPPPSAPSGMRGGN